MHDSITQLAKAVDEALDAWRVTRNTGGPSQGGEQRGNREHIVFAYDNLKFALEEFQRVNS